MIMLTGKDVHMIKFLNTCLSFYGKQRSGDTHIEFIESGVIALGSSKKTDTCVEREREREREMEGGMEGGHLITIRQRTRPRLTLQSWSL